MQISLEGKKALITGGSGSLGRALVEVFAECGAQIWFQYNRGVEEAGALTRRTGAVAVQADLLATQNIGPDEVDILVNNAGINIASERTADVPPEKWLRTLKLNLDVPVLLIQRYLPGMSTRKWGRIVNISSIYGLRGSVKNLPYNASKHGLSGVTKTVAKEYAAHGITCNEVCPGPMESNLMQRIALEKSAVSGVSADDYLRQVREGIPAGRMADPREIAHLAAFLCSDFAAYINGASIPIDGGLIA
jgi:3-hydroxybutyrate dehydrogenase